MNRYDLKAGAITGAIAAAATSGALVALGRRNDGAWSLFNVIAAHVVGGSRADVIGFIPGVTLSGIALHVVFAIALGVFSAATVRRRFAPAWIVTSASALLSALVSVGLARRGSVSLARALPVGDLLLFYVALSITLAVGLRYGLSAAGSNDEASSDFM